MNIRWWVLCLLTVAGCVAEVAPVEELYDEQPPQAQAAGLAEATDVTELQEAPPTAELMRAGAEPLQLEVPPEVSHSLWVEPRGGVAVSAEALVVGTDDRSRVADTTVAPYSTIAMLLVSFPSGGTGLCTGSVVGRDAVLTAGHCVYNAARGGWARSIRVIPGSYPGGNGLPAEPFGSTSGRKLYTPSAYRSGTSFWEREPHDYAVVRTTTFIGNRTGVRGLVAMPSPAPGRAVQLVGYHGDLCKSPPCSASSDAFIMHSSRDQVRKLLSDRLFNHYADSYPGSSGSPLVSDGAERSRIFAVHIAGLKNPKTGAEWNMGVLITSAVLTNVRNWVSAS
jgi:glutamyl endopeptidase